MTTQQVQQGWGQMTPAVQTIIRQGIGAVVRRATGRRRKKRASASAAPKRRRKRKASVKLKAGSAAAKAWGRKMARLRKKR